MFSLLKPAKLLQIAVLFLVQFFLGLGLIYTSPGMLAAASPELANQGIAQDSTTKSLDVDRAADKADEASENIYKGLDTTKRVIGKTDKRNQIIEQARGHASEKLKSLAEKAEAAQSSDTSLTPTEEKVLRRVQD